MRIKRFLQEIQYRQLRRKLTPDQLRSTLRFARQLYIPPPIKRLDIRAALAGIATIHTLATIAVIEIWHPVILAGLFLTFFTWFASLYSALTITHRLIHLTRRYHWIR